MVSSKAERLARLRSAPDPADKAAAAVELLEPRYGLEVVRAALHALVAYSHPPARPALRRLYGYYAEKGVARDPGAFVRSQILRALRPLALPEDIPLLLGALNTYEYPPPSFKEEAALLRAGALVILADLDEQLTRIEATRLLADGRTDPMSGEPALAAVEVLATLGETLPLLFYAMQPLERTLPEVAGECLRRLTGLPAAVLPALLAHYAECKQPVLLLGVVDLLFQHDEGPQGLDFLARLLHAPPDLDLYRYLIAAILATGRPELRALLAESARLEQNPARIAIVLELLSETGDPEWGELVETLRQRRRSRR